MSFNYLQSYVKMPVSACCYIPTLLPQEQAAKTSMVSEVRIQVLIREYGSTHYVGLARAVSPTNTNFRLTFLLTRLQEALYEDLAVQSIKFEVYHHFSGL